MTLNEIELDVYRRLDYADTPPPSVKNRIDGFINQRHRQLLASDRMRSLRLATTTLTSVAGIPSYGLPYGCARVARVTDQTNEYLLGTHTFEWVREQNPNPIRVTGTPTHWIPLGFSPVAMRPVFSPSAPALWIVAAAAPGPATYSLVLVGDQSGSAGQNLTLAPTLASPDPTVRQPITLPVGYTPTDILEFNSSVPVTASVAIYDAAVGGTLVSQISRNQTTARYYRIGFYPVPSAPVTYWIDYEREIIPLLDPNDEPLLPIDFHDIIALLARMDEYEFKSDDRWVTTRALVDQRTMELRQWVDNHDTFRAHAIPTYPRHSRLGPYFPAGT